MVKTGSNQVDYIDARSLRCENRIKQLIEKKHDIMKEFSIETLEELKSALGDRYNCGTRNELMSRFTKSEQVFLNEYYLRNCNAGMDRVPACVKIIINVTTGNSWIPKDKDHIIRINAEFDRVKSSVKYVFETEGGLSAQIRSSLNKDFEDDIFVKGEVARTLVEEDHYVTDTDTVNIRCEFGDGYSCKMKGNYPDDKSPYGDIYKKYQILFHELCESIYSLM